jgi:hypothetical protein
MFISKEEKKYVFDSIKELNRIAALLLSKQVDKETSTRKGRDWTPEQRAEASERMKKIHKARARL